MNTETDFQGVNLGYVLELYEKYLSDPNSVDPGMRAYFETWNPPKEALSSPEAVSAGQIDKIVGTVNLAESIRKFGHMDAQLDPLGSTPRGDYSLRLQSHGVSEDDLRRLPASLIVGPIAAGKSSAHEVIQALRNVYTTSTGYDYGHLRDPEERRWLHEAAESRRFRDPNDPVDAEALLELLTQVESFEHFLHRTFPGKTRFSVEGLDMLIPILDEMVGSAAEASVHNVLIGMAHRARLNVLAHILKKPYAEILAIFKDPVRARNFREGLGWDEVDARQNFGFYEVIVLLDFGLEPIDDLEVLECFEYTQKPVEVVPARLDRFRSVLQEVVTGARKGPRPETRSP